MNFFCCDDRRRAAVLASGLNGIDFLEVIDSKLPTDATRQRVLKVHFLKPLSGPPLNETHVRVEGGERIRNVRVIEATPVGDVLTVKVDRYGDYSPYTLRLVKDAQDLTSLTPPDKIDPALAAIVFSFKVECPSDFDCKPRHVCPPLRPAEVEIDYLAKDYASFRRLVLDRLTTLMPDWLERNAADLGVTLGELLAHVGDCLSYEQDAVATEAYLGTARRRVSARRHALLVDYAIDDGANVRTWVHLHVPTDIERTQATQPAPVSVGTPFSTRLPGLPAVLAKLPDNQVPGQVVFESMDEVNVLYAAHNEATFYTWSDQHCCLPAGAVRAYLRDDPARRLRLCRGDVLVFEEKRSPVTGAESDADPTRRWAVRLTAVTPEAIKVLQPFAGGDVEVQRTPGPVQIDEVTETGEAYVEINWGTEDALPFPFCVSATTDVDHGGMVVADVSVARGNLLLADHGVTVAAETLPVVPPPKRYQHGPDETDYCQERVASPVPARYLATLARWPLTQAAPYDPAASAAAARSLAPRRVLPALWLSAEQGGKTSPWLPRRDLLGSRPGDAHVVVEIETDGAARLRFGDGRSGQRPEPGTSFTVLYRVGNGLAGNVGADSLFHVVAPLPGVTVRNPLPAWGGRDPESLEDVRQRAPSAFRTQERAVTAADYAEVTERDPDVQRAAGTFRWTGSWHTAFLTVDRRAGRPVDASFRQKTLDRLERYRMAGQDVDVDAPRFVALELEMHVCAAPDYFRSHVKQALLEVFSAGVLPDGTLGQFHPDQFTFGQTVYLSRLIAAAQAVPGVASVQVKVCQRLQQPETSGLDVAELRFSRLEIPQLDNDRNYPERGMFRLDVGGGK